MDEFVLDRFVNEQNTERFRKLASAVTTETERKTLLKLLAAEEARFTELQKVTIGLRALSDLDEYNGIPESGRV